MSLHLITGYAGTEHITSADQGSFNAAFVGDGEFVIERGNQFEASIISNNKVRVLDGDLMMQGRHIRLNENTYEELNFENGTQGYKRNDLIVCRYSMDATTGIETAVLAVVKGSNAASNPADPTITTGDIITEHAVLNEFALWRVPFDGLTIQPLECMFETVGTFKNQADEAAASFEAAVEEYLDGLQILDTMEEIEANTGENHLAGALAVKELNSSLVKYKDITCTPTANSTVAPFTAYCGFSSEISTDHTILSAQIIGGSSRVGTITINTNNNGYLFSSSVGEYTIRIAYI